MINRIKNPALRRVALALVLLVSPILLLLAYLVALAQVVYETSAEFWEGFPSGIVGVVVDAWNGE